MTDDDHPELHTITMAVREADRHFERVGGSSRHWVRDCFLPMLEKHGLRIARLLDGIEGVPYRTPACDKHLSRNEEHECPWCKLETRETELADLEQRYFDEVEARSTDNAQAEIDASGLFEDFSKGPEGRPGQ